MLPVGERSLGANDVSLRRGLMGIPQRRALGSPSQHQLLGFWERLCYNGVPVILETGLKTIGLEAECLELLVLEEMFSIVDAPTKTTDQLMPPGHKKH